MHFIEDLKRFVPLCDQEISDKKRMLEAILKDPEVILTRESGLYHMTASSIIVNRDKTKTLMAYHNIYRSWAWTGGHADGESDLCALALREANEETGIKTLIPLVDGPVSIEILPVQPHIKRKSYVGMHLHLNLTYAFIGDESEALTVNADENTRVGWLPVDRLSEYVSEELMLPVYEKILSRIL